MSDLGNPGWQGAYDAQGVFNALSFMTRQALAEASHVAIVQVKATTADGSVAAPGTVNIQPIVAQVDQTGKAVPHGTIYNIPIFRLQGGHNAIIIDPQVGDLGIALFADRDISAAMANQGPSNPGSFRRFDWADGIYLGGVGRVVPTQYVEFNTSGITIHTPNDLQVTVSGTVTVTAPHVNVVSNDVNLGATGGAAVARVGDSVVGGVITSGSTKVKSA